MVPGWRASLHSSHKQSYFIEFLLFLSTTIRNYPQAGFGLKEEWILNISTNFQRYRKILYFKLEGLKFSQHLILRLSMLRCICYTHHITTIREFLPYVSFNLHLHIRVSTFQRKGGGDEEITYGKSFFFIEARSLILILLFVQIRWITGVCWLSAPLWF